MIWEIPATYEILWLIKIGVYCFNVSATAFILLLFVMKFIAGPGIIFGEISEQISEKGVRVYNNVAKPAKCSGVVAILSIALILVSILMLIFYPR